MGVETKSASTPGLGTLGRTGEGVGNCTALSPRLRCLELVACGPSMLQGLLVTLTDVHWIAPIISRHFRDEERKEKGNFAASFGSVSGGKWCKLSACLPWRCRVFDIGQVAVTNDFSCAHQVSGRLLASLTSSEGMGSTYAVLSPSPRWPSACSVGLFLLPQYCKLGGSPSSQGYPLVI